MIRSLNTFASTKVKDTFIVSFCVSSMRLCSLPSLIIIFFFLFLASVNKKICYFLLHVSYRFSLCKTLIVLSLYILLSYSIDFNISAGLLVDKLASAWGVTQSRTKSFPPYASVTDILPVATGQRSSLTPPVAEGHHRSNGVALRDGKLLIEGMK